MNLEMEINKITGACTSVVYELLKTSADELLSRTRETSTPIVELLPTIVVVTANPCLRVFIIIISAATLLAPIFITGFYEI